MIDIKIYGKKKNTTTTSSGGGNGFANYIINDNTPSSSADSVNGVWIWGQYHDHTQNITGDLTSNGKVTANTVEAETANIETINTETLNAGDATVTGKTTTGELETTYAEITTLDSTNINATTGNITTVNTDLINALSGIINSLVSTNITTENLTVTKAAHFFKLIIDEIKAAQGQIIITPANALIDKVEVLQSGDFKCYFRATDGDKKIYQNFAVNDQIVCQTFNVAEGTNYNVSNKFYWRLCTQVSNSVVQTQIDGETVDCHYIVLSNTDKDQYSNDVPERGDEIVMLGNRNNTTRQAAITIGAYNNPYLDNTIQAPFIIQYDGINDYNLSSHRKNIISNGLNQFKGTFTTNTGDDIEQLIADVGEGVITYVHTAYSNSADGRLNFSKTYFNNALYIGFCSNHTESDVNLTYSDYTWARLKGEDGEDGQDGVDGVNAESYKLSPIQENVSIDQNGTVGINIKYNIIHYSGTTVETISANYSNCYVRFIPTQARSIVTNYTNLSTGSTPTYTNYNYESNWKTNSDHLVYVTVELVKVDGSNLVVYDKRIVYAQLSSSASFTITDSITATVQGNYNELRGDINTNINAISTLQQDFDQIEATVESHTTSINTITDEVEQNTTDIANLTIRADGISSMVSKYSGVQLINNFGWIKADGTAAEYDDSDQSYDIVGSQWDNHTYYDVYSNVVKLVQGQEYVFSFYTEFQPYVSVLYSSTNKMPVDFGTAIPTTRTVYTSDQYLDNPRIGYKFTASYNGYYCINVGDLQAQAEAFYRPQLELGSVPTQYDVNSQMMSSEIVQTAQDILLQVGNCGININNQSIILGGNTTVIGNLTLCDADTGFLLQGVGGMTLITPQSIGTYTQFKSRTSLDKPYDDRLIQRVTKVTLNNIKYYKGLWFFHQDLGTIKQGTVLTLKSQNITLSYNYDTAITASNITVDSVSFKIYENGTLKNTITNQNQVKASIGTYTVSSDSDVVINVTINLKVLVSALTNYDNNGIDCRLVYITNVPFPDVFAMVGFDGFAANYGNNKHYYAGGSGFYAEYSTTSGIRVTEANGVQKLSPNSPLNPTYVGLSTMKVTWMPDYDYDLADDDELIIVNNSISANRTLTLSSTAVQGRKIYIKDYSNKSLTVYCPNKIIASNANSATSSITINNTAQMFIYDGAYWLEFYCG